MNLRKPGDSGKNTFIHALSIRGRCGDFNISDLVEIIDFEKQSFKDEYEDQIRWHKECYSAYVSKSNLKYAKICKTK